MLELTMKDIAIIDAFPVYDCPKIVLNVGCGKGRIDYHLARMGYHVYATDIKRYEDDWQEKGNLSFHVADIFDLSSFPVESAPIVICSQMLEHLRDYKKAFANLIALAEVRLVITFPRERSFHSPGHVNFWDDDSVVEFKELCEPYFISLSKIATRPEDMSRRWRDYLIIIDKRQRRRLK